MTHNERERLVKVVDRARMDVALRMWFWSSLCQRALGCSERLFTKAAVDMMIYTTVLAVW